MGTHIVGFLPARHRAVPSSRPGAAGRSPRQTGRRPCGHPRRRPILSRRRRLVLNSQAWSGFGPSEPPRSAGIHSAAPPSVRGGGVQIRCACGKLAVAAGGFGDTDRAGDLAMAGAGFPEVCGSLAAIIGPPARSWEALEAGSGGWYLPPRRRTGICPLRVRSGCPCYFPSLVSLLY